MATIAITGTVQDASGVGQPNVLVQLFPAPQHEQSAEAISGVGIVLKPVEVVTDGSGSFSINAVSGFRYALAIDDIGFRRRFIAPTGVSIRFDLLGLSPEIESAVDFTDASGADQVAVVVKASDPNTVKERYDTIILESSADGDVWSTATTFELEDDRVFYQATIAAATGTYFRAIYRNTDASEDSQPGNEVIADANEEELLISVDELKELYLFGVRLTDSDGTEFPDRLIAHYIKAAAAWLEKEIDIPLVARDIVEVHDHMAVDYGRWGWFQVDRYPVIRVDSLTFQYPSMTETVQINDNWIILQDEGQSGQIQIVPGQGNIADVLLIPGQLLPLWSGATGRVPGVWTISYRAGFEPQNFPDDMKHVIGMAASIGVLNIAGDLIAGAGIATVSIGIPGLNQSVGTTSSATNSGYGARIIEYQKEIKQAVPNLRRYYGKGTRLYVV